LGIVDDQLQGGDDLVLGSQRRYEETDHGRFPGYAWGFASKDEWADHLESYARKFDLQVETGVRVEKLTREGRIVQLHAADYKNPRQLQEGRVLVVGAGNSGAEIAIEVARTHKVILSGPSTGAIPFRPESVVARVLMPIIGRIIFHRC
jgi:putative flavoprotein involved in K+ transport